MTASRPEGGQTPLSHSPVLWVESMAAPTGALPSWHASKSLATSHRAPRGLIPDDFADQIVSGISLHADDADNTSHSHTDPRARPLGRWGTRRLSGRSDRASPRRHPLRRRSNGALRDVRGRNQRGPAGSREDAGRDDGVLARDRA